MKSRYNVLEVSNHLFATYYIHHKEKREMIELIYDLCFLYNSCLFSIVRIQTNDTFTLADNSFASTKKDIIRSIKIMTIDKKHLNSTYSLKFNCAQIKRDSNKIVLTKTSHIGGILSVTDQVANSTPSKGITRIKLLLKKLYLV